MQVKLMMAVLVLAAEMPAAVAQEGRLFRIDAKTPQGLQELLAYSKEPAPIVSAHRGGPMSGYPENCIATFEHTLANGFAMLEIDPRYAKDGAIVVHHDPTLERTTTGKGRLVDFSLDELKRLKLKDTAGKVTEERMPTLDEVLEWAREKTVLVLDQKDVPVAARVKKIEEHKAEAYAMLIVYSFEGAQECFRLNPNVMMEVMIPNREKAAEFDALGIPWRNVIAFVGHVPPEDRGLYELIHAKGAKCMIGTSRNLDRQVITGQVAEIKQLESGYREFLGRGADVLETDIPVLLSSMLYGKSAVPAGMSKWLEVR